MDNAADQVRVNPVPLASGRDGLVQRDQRGFGRRLRFGCKLYFWQGQIFFKMLNLFGRNVGVAGPVSTQIESGDRADLLVAFVPDGESIAEDGEIGSKRCGGKYQDQSCTSELLSKVHA